jgi:UDP-N-acetylglucosamine transferase subunit ALG13
MLPFDRLVRVMDDWSAQHPSQEVIAQIGSGKYEPHFMRWFRLLTPNQFMKVARDCSLIVAHAGTGSFFLAAELNKPIVMLPRLAKYREHTTDHQIHTGRWLQEKSGVYVAFEDHDLSATIQRAQHDELGAATSTMPAVAPSLIERVRRFVAE